MSAKKKQQAMNKAVLRRVLRSIRPYRVFLVLSLLNFTLVPAA